VGRFTIAPRYHQDFVPFPAARFCRDVSRIRLGVKVVDSRPARSAGRVKKSCFKTLENFCVCYEGSVLSSMVIKIHLVFHADEFSISKNTHNANFTKIWLKQAF